MRVHDMPPIPAEYFVLRPQPKPPDIEPPVPNERRVEDQVEEDRDRPSRRPRKRTSHTPYLGTEEEEDATSHAEAEQTPHLDLLA